jgi:hypothetical protein
VFLDVIVEVVVVHRMAMYSTVGVDMRDDVAVRVDVLIAAGDRRVHAGGHGDSGCCRRLRPRTWPSSVPCRTNAAAAASMTLTALRHSNIRRAKPMRAAPQMDDQHR